MEVHTEQQILSKYSTAVIFGLWDEFTKLSKLKEALEGPSEACSSVFLSCRLGLYQAYCFLCYTGFELLTAAWAVLDCCGLAWCGLPCWEKRVLPAGEGNGDVWVLPADHWGSTAKRSFESPSRRPPSLPSDIAGVACEFSCCLVKAAWIGWTRDWSTVGLAAGTDSELSVTDIWWDGSALGVLLAT